MEYYRMSAQLLPRIHFVDQTTLHHIHRKRRAGEYIMYLVQRGEMHIEEDGIPMDLGEHDVCILHRDRTHVGTAATACEYYYIHFTHADFAPMSKRDDEALAFLLSVRLDSLKSDIFSYDKCENTQICLPSVFHLDDSTWIKVENLMKQAIQENYSPLENYKMTCACDIWQAFMEMSRSFLTGEQEKHSLRQPEYVHRVNEILEWLNREYQTEVTGERLEQEIGGNFDYLNRIFKKVTGQTVFQYLTQIRIARAKILILHTAMRISDIGRQVGFPDEYYFSRVFKKHVGMSPAAFSKNYQKKSLLDK